MEEEQDRYITTQEATNLLSITRAGLHSAVKYGRIRRKEINKRIHLYHRRDCILYKRERKQRGMPNKELEK